LLWSHYKLFWVDELLEFYTDSKSSAAAIIFGQLHYPFSLEPPAFHLLLHFMERLFPAHPELGSRLISILALLVIEFCVFRITFRLTAQANAALIAMALPFLFVTIDYAPEARVYNLLAALFALAILSYQSAIEDTGGSRVFALAGLFASLSAAILIHYYGLLLPLPILAGEMVRTLRLRRIDWALLVVIAGSFAMFGLNLPFLKPLHEIQANYYNTGEARSTMIPFTYLWLVLHFKVYYYLSSFQNYRTQVLYYLITVACLVTVTMLVFFRILRPARIDARLPVLLTVLCGYFLPVANVLVAHYVTHAYVPRYSLPAVVSLSILAALLLEPLLRHPLIFTAALLLVLGEASHYAAYNIQRQRAETRLARTEFGFAPALRAELAAQPDHQLYVQDAPRFLILQTYLPLALRPSVIAIGSSQRELFWMYRNTTSLFLRNMGLTTNLPVTAYETVERTPGPHLFVIYNEPGEEWIGPELVCRGLLGKPLGRALGGTIYRVTFPEDGTPGSSQTCTSHPRR
jgi:4-amino-4-deoxy-L-arabinose transferase-like glycosyltransferase